jgi:SAM-dependent methyltransferase
MADPTVRSESPASRPQFACPVHKTRLSVGFHCDACVRTYPAVNGVPVLLNDANSVFAIADFLQVKSSYVGASGYSGHLDRRYGVRQIYRRVMHRLLESDIATREFGAKQAMQFIQQRQPEARVLIVGAGDTTYSGNVVYTDVAFGKNVSCIADAHDLPFESGSFDACIACNVLEHVADPQRCVAEIERVLRLGGYVYAETPFMQPVHMGAYDFTRFTFLGHRRLFRRFDELRSGMAAGPASSATQTLRYAIVSMSDRSTTKKWLRLLGLLVTYPFRFLDKFMKSHNSSYDSASGFYFLGTLRVENISDREILGFFRGG